MLLVFDALLVDFALIKDDVPSEEFKSTVTKFDLTKEPALQTHVDAIVDKLHELNSIHENEVEQ